MNPIYMDYAATTPMRAEVREAMLPYLSETFGNPSSVHRWGRAAAEGLAEARAKAAAALGAHPSEIYFTRGGTESDNLAVLGRCRRLASEGQGPTLLFTAVEHHAVHDAAENARSLEGTHTVVIPVSADGALDFDVLEEALAGGPCVVSVMWVNNETGLRFPVDEVAHRVAAAGATLHSDAVQAVGKVPVSVSTAPVDLLSVTGHKIYGPKGTGLLYVRPGTELTPLIFGGGQERAVRPGTEDVAGAVGFATALELAVAEQAEEAERLRILRERLEARVLGALDGVRVNAGGAERAPHVSSLGLAAVDGEGLIVGLDLEGVAASGGAACASGSTGGSHVIAALYGPEDDRSTVRFSLGRGSTESEVDEAVDVLTRVVTRLRASGGAP